MPKRGLEDASEDASKRFKSAPTADVDFVRGGGSSFTPLESKAIRAEALQELKDEVFKDKQATKTKSRTSKTKGKKQTLSTSATLAKEDTDRIRVEHLNYKKLVVGQRLLCQITHIHPLALIVSLPNQLAGHIPITHISSHFTEELERLDEYEANSDNDGDQPPPQVSDLADIYSIGQYVNAVVTQVHVSGTRQGGAVDLSKSRDESVKSSRRVELSISPEQVNAGVSKQDLRAGFNVSGAVKSVEDHGYIIDVGVPDVSGFLSLKEAKKGGWDSDRHLTVGQVVNTSVVKLSENGRTVTLSVDPSVIRAASVSEVHAVTSVLPGSLVQALITSVLPWGLNVQLLGFFNGTLDLFHLTATDVESKYKIGQKIKARVLWDIPSSSPRTFALSALPHIISLDIPKVDAKTSVQSTYPVGTVLDSVSVERVESEWGLVCSLPSSSTARVMGFVHISEVSDEHVPSLSSTSGTWKISSSHRARVIGFSSVDGLLLLTLRPSVIDQKFLKASDVRIGEVVKGTVKSLSNVGLFVALSEAVDGVVWPTHFADIKLKNPERRFKIGSSVKCRVLNVDTAENRISLTLKKTLVDTDLAIITTFEDAKVGTLSHAVVTKLLPKSILVSYFSGIKAFVPLKEAAETDLKSAEGVFTIGQVVRTRVIATDPSSERITASIRQAAPNYVPPVSIADIPITTGTSSPSFVSATVVEIQKNNIVATLSEPYEGIRGLMSLANLAASRGVSVAQLRTDLQVGEVLTALSVVSKNVEKGFVILSAPRTANVSTAKSSTNISIDTLKPGDVIPGRIVSHTRHGSVVRISNTITGLLHPTDVSDDFSAAIPYPSVNTTSKFAILDIDQPQKRLTLSTRPSRLGESDVKVVDPEVDSLEKLEVGSSVRGFVKSVADHGLFVSIGRGLDARVQIRELFDEYVKDWKPRFTVNQVVRGRVLKIDTEKNQLEMTLKSRDLDKPLAPTLSFSDLTEGENVDAVVKKVESYGLFIEIANSKISGLCHKTELSDNKKANVGKALLLFKAGDPVRAHILSVDAEKRRINFSLKPSHFADEQGEKMDEDEDEDDDDDDEEAGSDVEMESAGEDEEDEDAENDDDDDDDDVVMADAPKAPTSVPTTASGDAPVFELSRGFRWGHQAEDDAESEPPSSSDEGEDDSEADEAGPSTSKPRKKKNKHEIQKDLTTEMHSKVPESTADFERLLLGSPNSSFLWIQYMSFQLQLSEVDKAREIGQRALKAINFREEQEKLNVWIALLNLENSFGTDETLEAVFRDAVRHNEAKHMHLRFASILDETGKYEKAEEIYKRTTKKFGQSSKVWTLFGEYYLRRGQLEEARKLLPRSLQSLEKRKHLKTISKFAQLEYKLGDPERGKTIFEGIIDSHPKRYDLWSIYMDMEAGQKAIESLRSLFDRVLSQKLSSKKAKFFFKKWLALEKSIGDGEGEAVKARAIAWTQGQEA